jgi:hypothetical protein
MEICAISGREVDFLIQKQVSQYCCIGSFDAIITVFTRQQYLSIGNGN